MHRACRRRWPSGRHRSTSPRTIDRRARHPASHRRIRAEHNLPTAVRDARIVVLAMPVSQVRETLEFIAPDLQENTVVLDTSPVKSNVAKWAKELLPEGRYYVGLAPAINPVYMHDFQFGQAAAKADLFARWSRVALGPLQGR